eukprot:scaffold649164_cov51-Prasinocladus_malaysianus.AAC.1
MRSELRSLQSTVGSLRAAQPTAAGVSAADPAGALGSTAPWEQIQQTVQEQVGRAVQAALAEKAAAQDEMKA